MGHDVQTQEAKTTYTPSQFDLQKAQTLSQLRELLFPAMTPQLSGAMTSKTEQGLMTANQKGMGAAAGAGVGPGAESLISMMGSGKGDKSSALNMALQLYGYAPSGQPSSTSTAKPSAMGAGASIAGLAGSAGKLGYDIYKNWPASQYDPYSNFNYPEGTAMTPGNYMVNTPTDYGAGAGISAEAGAGMGAAEAGTGAAAAASEASTGSSIWEMIAALF